MYTLYVGNFDKATETLSTWTKKSPAMAAVIEEIQVSFSFFSCIRLNCPTIKKLLIIRTSYLLAQSVEHSTTTREVVDSITGDRTNTLSLKITEK